MHPSDEIENDRNNEIRICVQCASARGSLLMADVIDYNVS